MCEGCGEGAFTAILVQVRVTQQHSSSTAPPPHSHTLPPSLLLLTQIRPQDATGPKVPLLFSRANPHSTVLSDARCRGEPWWR